MIERIYCLAEQHAIAARARGHSYEERRWLDVCALIDQDRAKPPITITNDDQEEGRRVFTVGQALAYLDAISLGDTVHDNLGREWRKNELGRWDLPPDLDIRVTLSSRELLTFFQTMRGVQFLADRRPRA